MNFEVMTESKNVNEIFSSINSPIEMYRIDFYQREYKWRKNTVERLLDDIFDAFHAKYTKNSLEGAELEKNVADTYGWHYLHTIIINNENNHTYLVDGQQRLSTLLLILIALYHLSKDRGQFKERIKQLLLVDGKDNMFSIDHGESNQILKAIYLHSLGASEPEIGGITSKTLRNNYIIIYEKLRQKMGGNLDKLDTFVIFFIKKIILINLKINNTKDVPMVFEVINDRGEALKPHEVLKGKLLAKIDKKEVLEENGYNEQWKKITNNLLNRGKDVDLFFEHLLTARYSESQEDRDKYFARDKYHRGIYQFMLENKKDLFSDERKIKKFLDKDLQYYAQLYLDLIQDNEEIDSCPAVFYNHLTGMENNQFLLVMAGIACNDRKREEKIRIISEELDRFRVLLSMQGGV